jgi:hypothetical protein
MGARSSPKLRLYTPENVTEELERQASEFLNTRMEITPSKKENEYKCYMPMLLKWYQKDFGEKDAWIKFIADLLPFEKKQKLLSKNLVIKVHISLLSISLALCYSSCNLRPARRVRLDLLL